MNQKKLKRVIGIDGPVASGKTDIGLSLAKILGWKFLDTGFMYRAIAFSTKQFKGFDKNPSSMKKTLSSAQFCFDQSYPGTLRNLPPNQIISPFSVTISHAIT